MSEPTSASSAEGALGVVVLDRPQALNALTAT